LNLRPAAGQRAGWERATGYLGTATRN